MEALKITRPSWVGYLGPHIQKYLTKVGHPNITYETLFTQFTNMVQFGKDTAEVWVVIHEDKPVSFATWFIEAPPIISTAFWDHIFKWVPEKEPVLLLGDEFLNFAKRNRCEFMKCRAYNNRVASLIKGYASERNIEVEDKPELFLFAKRS